MPSKYQCHFCPEVFEQHTELFKHQRTKHVKKSTTLTCQCAVCGVEFLDPDSKTSHIHKKHPELMDRLFQAEKAYGMAQLNLESNLQNNLSTSLQSNSQNNLQSNLQNNLQSNSQSNSQSNLQSNPYKQKENHSRQSQKSRISESNSFLATLLKW